jgi:hypothetical protein
MLGFLQVSGEIDLQPEGEERPTRVRGNEHAVFSSDRIMTRSGSAVLAFDEGGALGIGPGSEIVISRDPASNNLSVKLESGTLLFNLPDRAGIFRIETSEFTLQSEPSHAQRVNVSLGSEGLSGRLHLLADGHLEVAIDQGTLFTQTGNGSRYQVSAGDRIGLLSGLDSVVATQIQSASTDPVRIEAPEQVGTNDEFRIRWEGETAAGENYITIAPEGAEPEEFERVMSTSEGSILDFEAPDREGDYEIRYIDGTTGEINGFVYLQVVENEPVLWWTNNTTLGAMTVVGGAGTALLIIDDGDEGPTSISP